MKWHIVLLNLLEDGIKSQTGNRLVANLPDLERFLAKRFLQI
jgi:hypothetical protein